MRSCLSILYRETVDLLVLTVLDGLIPSTKKILTQSLRRSKSFWLIVFTLPLLAIAQLTGAYCWAYLSYPIGKPLVVAPLAVAPVAVSRMSMASDEALETRAREVLASYCTGCHSAGRSGADFDETTLQLSAMQRDRALWEVAVRKLRSGSMPPRGFPRPLEEDRLSLIQWIEKKVLHDESNSTSPIMARRLLRTEYNNAIHDLFGMDLKPATDLPPDDYGWDNSVSVPVLAEPMREQYRRAAAAIIDVVLAENLASSGPSECDLETPAVRDSAHAAQRFICNLKGKTETGRTREVLASFAHRAYRRPIESFEADHLAAIFESAAKAGASYKERMRAALMEVLTSPHFLYRIETRAAANEAQASPPLRDAFVLASRISSFLWSSIPDDELLCEADKGLTPKGLEAQVRRMLMNPHSQALAIDFAGHWLSLARLDKNHALDKAMRQETELFFATIVREDRSVLEFLDADYTFLNEPLAKHYGIEGVHGEPMRRVTLSNTNQRGGLLAQASILKLTSDIDSTSPARRGKWILENLLAAAPIHPPLAVVEALQSTPKRSAMGTVRQHLQEHRANPSCAACHARMDTLGLALENFGPTGAWRAESDGYPIEPAGELPDGERMNDPAELKAYLLKHHEQFVQALSERLLEYALSRKLTDRDRAALAHIPERVAAQGFHFSQVVLEVSQSEPFLAGWHGVDAR